MEEDDEATTPPKWEENFRRTMTAKRERMGVSQTAMAKELQRRGLQFRQQMVQRVESGERALRLNEAVAVADILALDFDAAIRGPEADEDALRRQYESKLREAVSAVVKLEEARGSLDSTLVEVKQLIEDHVNLADTGPLHETHHSISALMAILTGLAEDVGKAMEIPARELLAMYEGRNGEHSQDS